MAVYNGSVNGDVYTGTTGADTVNGNGGNDTLDGNFGDDTVNGGAGNDSLGGGEGNDVVDGGIGDDLIQEIDNGIDTLRGGDGNDYVRGGLRDSLDGGAGYDQIYLDLRSTAPVATTSYLSGIESSAGATLHGNTTAKNFEYGLIIFDRGDDTIFMGTAGGFEILAGSGNDTFWGGDLIDTVSGQNGIDRLNGNGGNDVLNGDGGNDILSGDAGDDRLFGGNENDTLNGGIGNDFLDGGDGIDVLNGEGGDDTLTGGIGDAMDGGEGTDMLSLDLTSLATNYSADLAVLASGGTVDFGSATTVRGVENGTLRFGIGTHIITSAAGWTVYGGGGADTILGGSFSYGEVGNDKLYGDSGANLLNGGDGDDHLFGAVGDTLDGGIGTDTFELNLQSMTTGVAANLGGVANSATTLGTASLVRVEQGSILLGSGNDQIVMGGAAIVVYGGDGADTITGSSFGSRFYGEGGDDTLNGGGANDFIYGGEGADTINGNSGNDVIEGGIGADTMNGGIGNDRFVFTFAAGTFDSTSLTPDTIIGFVSGQDKIDIPTSVNGLLTAFTGAAFDFDPAVTTVQVDSDYIGDGIADTMWRYDSAANRVDVWIDADDNGAIGGGDLLLRMAGKTTLSTSDFSAAFSAARPPVTNDIIEGTPGNDTLKGGGGNDIVHGRLGDDTIYGESGNDRLFGDEGEDALFGGSGDDYLEGGVGDDLDGGTGIDEFTMNLRAMTSAAIVDLRVLGSGGTIQFGANTSLVRVEYGRIDFGSGDDQVTLWGPQQFGTPPATYTISVYGGDGADTITGSAADDEAWGEAGNDILKGAAGNDKLWGGDGNNDIDGEGGDDLLVTGVGDDRLSGGLGNDILRAGEGADTLDGGAGDDLIEGGLGGDTMTGGAGVDRYVFGFGIPRSESTPSAVDVITDFEGAGVAGGDLIDLPAFAGNLPLVFNLEPLNFTFTGFGEESGYQLPFGLVGDGLVDVSWKRDAVNNRVEIWVDANDDGQFSEVDMLFHLQGVSTIGFGDFVDRFTVWRGTQGPDLYTGTDAPIVAYALGGDDVLNTYGGDDSVFAGEGADLVNGGTGGDTLRGDGGNDTLNGEGGGDSLIGGTGDDILNGGDDGDSLSGDAGGDQLNGDAGNDFIDGGEGADIVHGGIGDDLLGEGVNWGNSTFIRGGPASGNHYHGDEGNDTIWLVTSAGANGTVDGGTGNDSLHGVFGAGLIVGGAGNDVLMAGGGAWSIDGGADNDTLFLYLAEAAIIAGGTVSATGGTGADRFVVHHSSRFGEQDRIADFAAAQGDLLQIADITFASSSGTSYGRYDGASTIFRGSMDPASFVLGAALPGSDLGTELVQFWTVQSGGNTYLLGDLNRDLKFDAADFVLRFDGLIGLTEASFVAGTFIARAGTPNPDTLTGTSGADQLYGVAGNDIINGLEGNDALYGGLGDDQMDGGANDDYVEGGEGNDTLSGGVGTDVLSGQAGNDTLNGNAGGDSLSGGDGSDILNGGDDGDFLNGEAGDDTLSGDIGNDSLQAGAGNDILRGGVGEDSLQKGFVSSSFYIGADGNSELYGEDGHDSLLSIVNAGFTSLLDGGLGNDSLTGVGAGGSLTGGAGNDSLSAGGGTWTMDGGADDDTLFLFIGAVFLITAGVQTATGGTGADRFIVHHSTRLGEQDRITDFSAAQGDLVQIADLTFAPSSGSPYGRYNGYLTILRGSMDASLFVLGAALPGTDLGSEVVQFWTAQSGGNTFLVGDLNRDLTFDAADFVLRFDGLINLTEASFVAGTFIARAGSPNPDTLTGTSGADQLYGVAGNDIINGLDGNDALYGGSGDDQIDGGANDDHVEGGEGNDTLTGSVGADNLFGQAGSDTLNGSAGGDSLSGGDGNDVLNGGDDGDFLSGEAGDDTLNGDLGNDSLNAGTGNDVLRGGVGEDSLQKGFVSSSFYVGADGNSQLYGEDGNDALLSVVNGGFTSLLEGGLGNDSLTGAGAGGSLVGGVGNDILAAGGGAWTIDGGADDDTLYLYIGAVSLITAGVQAATGGTGADRFVVHHSSRYGEQDRITDFNAGQGDLVQIADITFHPSNGTPYGRYNGYSTILRGSLDPASFVLGAALPGSDLGTELVQFWTVQSGGDTYLVGDLNRNLKFDAADFVLRFDGLISLTEASFVAGTFIARAGTPNADTLTGTSGADQLHGVAGNDIVNGLEGNDALYGGFGDDQIDGGANDDYAEGGEGNDTFAGGVGADTLLGQAGNDILDGDAGGDNLWGGDGDDLVNGGDDGDGLYGEGGNDVLNGQFGQDMLDGGAGDDILDGGGDNDFVRGRDGADLLRGGDADDFLVGDGGDDRLFGGVGNDVLRGGDLLTQPGVHSGGESDTADYSSTAAGGIVIDLTLTVQAFGFAGADQLIDIENLVGTDFADVLTGDAADNVIEGGDGDDLLSGANGIDTASYASAASGVTVNLGRAGTQNTFGAGIDSLAEFENLLGSAYNDILIGTGAANLLNGGAGSDKLEGKSGDDRYIVDNAGDQVAEAADEGFDTIESSVSYSIAGQFVEVLKLTGSAAINGTGNNLVNLLSGNDGANLLNGGGGADAMSGGGGNDRYVVDNVGDTVVELAGAGTDRVDSKVTFTIGDNVEALALTGSATIHGTGNALANTLIGNSAGNIIDGGAGADLMDGKGGNDRYIVDNAGDKVTEVADGGTDTVEASVTFSVAGQYIETLRLTGTAAINGTGNGQANSIYGNAAANVINAGAGDDKLYGGAGSDMLTGGLGVDRFIFDTALSAATNVDKILDFNVADDGIYLSRSVFSGVASGALAAGAFVNGTAALDTGDRILYDKASGNIFYDGDGTGAGAAVLFASVTAGSALTSADFIGF